MTTQLPGPTTNRTPVTAAQSDRSGPPYLQTLGNGLIAMVALAEHGPLSLRDLSKKINMSRPATYRLVYTLVNHGFVRRDESGDTYRMGLKVWELGLTAHDRVGFMSQASAQVQSLSTQSGETVHLSVLDGTDVVYIDKADGSQAITSYSKLGGRAPAHCVATGKSLLAELPDIALEPMISSIGKAYTSTSITTADAFREEIRQVRTNGYAVNRGEWRTGVSGVAIAIRMPVSDEPFGLGFSGPSERIESRIDELVGLLTTAREQVISHLRSE